MKYKICKYGIQVNSSNIHVCFQIRYYNTVSKLGQTLKTTFYNLFTAQNMEVSLPDNWNIGDSVLYINQIEQYPGYKRRFCHSCHTEYITSYNFLFVPCHFHSSDSCSKKPSNYSLQDEVFFQEIISKLTQ